MYFSPTERVNFFELDGNYLPKDPCCDRFNFVLSATQNGREQRVETVGGTENVPSAIWESVELIENFFEQNPTQ